MTFENHTRGEFHQQNKSANDALALDKEEKKTAQDSSNEDPELLQAKKAGHPDQTVGYIGGQAAGDNRGLDISQYTGPASKSSSEFNDPKAPYHQGPGSGLSKKEETEKKEWENPDPGNDSF